MVVICSSIIKGVGKGATQIHCTTVEGLGTIGIRGNCVDVWRPVEVLLGSPAHRVTLTDVQATRGVVGFHDVDRPRGAADTTGSGELGTCIGNGAAIDDQAVHDGGHIVTAGYQRRCTTVFSPYSDCTGCGAASGCSDCVIGHR